MRGERSQGKMARGFPADGVSDSLLSMETSPTRSGGVGNAVREIASARSDGDEYKSEKRNLSKYYNCFFDIENRNLFILYASQRRTRYGTLYVYYTH